MGIFDSVKSKLGLGTTSDAQEYDEQEYDDERYDYDEREYDDEDYEQEDQEYEQGDDYQDYRDATPDYSGQANSGQVRTRQSQLGFDKSRSMRSFGVDRADYYNDNHAPLVSLSDVRSQPIPLNVSPRVQRGDDTSLRRNVVPRSASVLQTQPADMHAYKDGLARSTNNFAELHEQRLHMENSGRLYAGGTVGVQSGGMDNGIASMQNGDPGATLEHNFGLDGNAIYAGDETGRYSVHRRIEYIRPLSYGEAEQVTKELKRGIIVVLDLRSTRPELAKRILDFSFGVVSAMEGQVERHIDRIYVFAVNEVLTSEEMGSIHV